MERTIFHCDLNNFYASVECLHHPEYRNIPIAVGGDVEKRHGIILAKNMLAKKAGVTTGEALWQAKLKCPDLTLVKPNFSQYLRFSGLVRKIYAEYSDRIESFGIDEVWIDVTEIVGRYASPRALADEIRNRIREEVGITASIGVSFNKVFAKLGSDYKKPDATTVITRENMKEIVFPLPVEDLLYVGRKTTVKMHQLGIYTIGDCARYDVAILRRKFGKWGEYIWTFANGLENSPVLKEGREPMVKSVGNSTTAPRDLKNLDDVRIVCYVLSESVAARLREAGLRCMTVAVSIRDNDLEGCVRQMKLPCPSDLSDEIAKAAMTLFQANVDFQKPLRSIGVKAADLCVGEVPLQLSIFEDQEKREENLALEKTIDGIRRRFGAQSIQRLRMLEDTLLSGFNPKQEHVIFPESYFKG
ncbi:MAG: DNA polymerase IV [Firmicutes bacterium GWF2_51_9]|nr:MAG: DNA polymerase IV [Firmicutes bacterium GWF2_51_9]OGS59026.1 MAG: DNA polymerase IV [Firmicutes bacterium GWE2_51_13]HAM62857.1 DNA polymerase IV [Erysipelotrichaceae bacterium]HAO62098.1 DNA polymerase IV [Erysipelotrichaceae bacterium]HBZ40668.1 DNA polymerase IV [Erysipelotrichaceae bacterium]